MSTWPEELNEANVNKKRKKTRDRGGKTSKFKEKTPAPNLGTRDLEGSEGSVKKRVRVLREDLGKSSCDVS